MVLVALLVPLVLLPVSAYAVDAAALAVRSGRLQESANQAALDAAQALDESALRSGAAFRLDTAAAGAAAASTLAVENPAAHLDAVTVNGTVIRVACHDLVQLQFGGVLVRGPITLRATAVACLTPGYGSPSSLRPLPSSSFSSTGSGSSSAASSSRQRWGWMNG